MQLISICHHHSLSCDSAGYWPKSSVQTTDPIGHPYRKLEFVIHDALTRESFIYPQISFCDGAATGMDDQRWIHFGHFLGLCPNMVI